MNNKQYVTRETKCRFKGYKPCVSFLKDLSYTHSPHSYPHICCELRGYFDLIKFEFSIVLNSMRSYPLLFAIHFLCLLNLLTFVRVPGIEPGTKSWQDLILPLNHTRKVILAHHFFFKTVQPY